jgi:hypothetical protein
MRHLSPVVRYQGSVVLDEALPENGRKGGLFVIAVMSGVRAG